VSRSIVNTYRLLDTDLIVHFNRTWDATSKVAACGCERCRAAGTAYYRGLSHAFVRFVRRIERRAEWAPAEGAFDLNLIGQSR
jgi:hypothetical protein